MFVKLTCLSAHHHSGGYMEFDLSSDLHSAVGPDTIVAIGTCPHSSNIYYTCIPTREPVFL